jgi:hypothetical protein
LCWTVAPADGRLAVTKRRRLADGLEVLASDDVLPLWAQSADGWLLRQSGKIREPDPVKDIPAWLLNGPFGAQWQAVG